MKIEMSEQVLRGNFGGNTDDENQAIAERYVEILEAKLETYCEKKYPDAELVFSFRIERASGVGQDFAVDVDDDDETDTTEIMQDIELEYRYICEEMDRSGAIYETQD